MDRGTSTAVRIAAPLAFLLAATVLILLVRSALEPTEPVAGPDTTTVETQPADTAPPEQEEPAPPPTPPPPTEQEPEPAFYVIESGDTLEAIALRHDTTVERLLELNPGIDPVALTVGQRIRVS